MNKFIDKFNKKIFDDSNLKLNIEKKYSNEKDENNQIKKLYIIKTIQIQQIQNMKKSKI